MTVDGCENDINFLHRSIGVGVSRLGYEFNKKNFTASRLGIKCKDAFTENKSLYF